MDLTLQQIYTSCQPDHQKGYQAVCHALLTDDRLEDWLSKLAGELAYQVLGERALLDSMPTAQPPGVAQTAPTLAVSDTTVTAGAFARRCWRLRNGGVRRTHDEEDATMATTLRRPRARRSSGTGGGGAAPVSLSPSGSPPVHPAGSGRGGRGR